MNVVINLDLSSVITTDDDTRECRLPNYNPETLVPFGSQNEVRAYAALIESKPNFFKLKSAQTPVIKVSPVEFKLLFTAQERVAIYASTDAFVKDFLSLVDNPRLEFVNLSLQSTKDALSHLKSLGLITNIRREEILTGVFK